MDSGQLFLSALALAMLVILGVREIVPRKISKVGLEGRNTEMHHYHGNRAVGAMFLAIAIFGAIKLAIELQWLRLPNITS